MKFCASNIAWTYDERHLAYAALLQAGFDQLEIAPGIFFAGQDDVFTPTDAVLAQALAETQLKLVSMQALLFGVQGAALFGTDDERHRFHTAMARAITLAGRLGIGNLVFGSPAQRRIPATMTAAEANQIAAHTFQSLGDLAQTAGTRIAIEPNPAAYGTNFLNSQAQAETFLDLVDHPAICGIIDTGAMTMNGDSFGQVSVNLSRIGHAHLSAPQLAPAPQSQAQATTVLAGLQALGYTGTVSIEMKRGPNGLLDLQHSIAHLTAAAQSLGLIGHE